MQEVNFKGIETKVLRGYSSGFLVKLQKSVKPSTAARIEAILRERGARPAEVPPFQDLTVTDLMRAVSELTLAGNEPALQLIHQELERRNKKEAA